MSARSDNSADNTDNQSVIEIPNRVRPHSILTFNMSVKNKANVSHVSEPFQIMPATQNYISETSLKTYVKGNNPNLLLHMNYITHVFSNKAITNDSSVRHSLRMYTKLAKILGTKDILIHMPSNVEEWNNLAFGISVINDEIISAGCIIHLEIPSWSRDLCELFKASKDSNPIVYMSKYLDTVLDYCKELPEGSYMIVPDTAHLWANGCTEYSHFEHVLLGYIDYIKYIHMNGNICIPFKMDTHAPIFDETYNKIKCNIDIATLCARMGVICIAEITKYGLQWNEWTECASAYGFDIVEYNEAYTI